MDETRAFKAICQNVYLKSKNTPGFPADHLEIYKSFAQGKCFKCNNKVIVTKKTPTGSGVKYELFCGHSLDILDLKEAPKFGEGHSYSSSGVNKSGHHDVNIVKGGSSIRGEAEELVVAKIFSHNYRPELAIFNKDKVDSPYDVIAKSTDNSIIEFFQITKVEDEEFWKKLNVTNEIDTIIPQYDLLVKQAVNRKYTFDPIEKSKIILLLQSRPGIVRDLACKISTRLKNYLEESGFKEIWIVGATRELTHKIL